jgi:hypothetical protein
VESRGAGNVGKSTVVSITILKLERDSQRQKTIIVLNVVEKKKDLLRRDIVGVDVQDIVKRDGKVE